MKKHLADDEDYRLIQTFISPQATALYEVFQHLHTMEIRCTCPGSQLRLRRRTCRHVEWVEAHCSQNGYKAMLTNDYELPSDEEREAATKDSRAWDRLIRRYVVPQVV